MHIVRLAPGVMLTWPNFGQDAMRQSAMQDRLHSKIKYTLEYLWGEKNQYFSCCAACAGHFK